MGGFLPQTRPGLRPRNPAQTMASFRPGHILFTYIEMNVQPSLNLMLFLQKLCREVSRHFYEGHSFTYRCIFLVRFIRLDTKSLITYFER